MDSQNSDTNNQHNVDSSVVETTKLNEVTKNIQSNPIQNDCQVETQEKTSFCQTPTTETIFISCDNTFPTKNIELIDSSGYIDCDKVDKVVAPVVDEIVMCELRTKTKEHVDSTDDKSTEKDISTIDAEYNCTSPTVAKLNNQSSNKSIQEVVDKVNKLDIVENDNNSSVILKNETSSFRNLLLYHSESSEDEDFEANWQLHVFPSSSSSSDSESDSQECVEISEEDDNVDFVLPNNKNSQKKIDKQNFEPTEPPPDLSNLQIDYGNEQFLHIGHITNFINTTVTVDALEHTDSYNLDTVLFIDDKTSKKPLGAVSDVIGPVHQPVYCVQLHDPKDIENLGLKEGMKVYSAPKSTYTKYVFLKDLLRMKGTDASWEGDEELPSDEADTSEEEFEMDDRTSRKRVHNNSLERHKQFEHAKNRCNIIKSQVANMFDKYKPKPRAPNIHTFPLGFDPRVPPPNMQSNVGATPFTNPHRPPFNPWSNGSPHPNHNRRFPGGAQFRGHSNNYFTNNVGYHHNAAGPSHQNYY